MVGKVIIRPVQTGDIDHIAANMREADRLEVLALRGDGTNMKAALAEGVLVSSMCWVAALGAEPFAIFGVMPVSLLHGIGAPWMLGTDLASRVPRVLVREGRRYSQQMLGKFPYLINFVDARYARSINWLQHIGYTVFRAEPYGMRGELFCRFEMKKEASRGLPN
jgi:hypothetical protein